MEWNEYQKRQKAAEGRGYRFAIVVSVAIAAVFVLGMLAQGAGF